jgi:hypothetical protein
MTTNREDEALDALIASFYVVDPDDLVSLDDPSILTEEDRKAIDALGDDLIDRLLAKAQESDGSTNP